MTTHRGIILSSLRLRTHRRQRWQLSTSTITRIKINRHAAVLHLKLERYAISSSLWNFGDFLGVKRSLLRIRHIGKVDIAFKHAIGITLARRARTIITSNFNKHRILIRHDIALYSMGSRSLMPGPMYAQLGGLILASRRNVTKSRRAL